MHLVFPKPRWEMRRLGLLRQSSRATQGCVVRVETKPRSRHLVPSISGFALSFSCYTRTSRVSRLASD